MIIKMVIVVVVVVERDREAAEHLAMPEGPRECKLRPR